MAFDSRECEFADISVSLLGNDLSGLRGITYDYEQEKDYAYGKGNKPKSIQRGLVKPGGSLKILKSDLDDLNTAARAAGYKNIVGVPGKLINLTIVYQKDDGDPIKTDRLIYVEFTKLSEGMNSGDKFKEVELPFLFLDIKQA